jgi:hypothetical protein
MTIGSFKPALLCDSVDKSEALDDGKKAKKKWGERDTKVGSRQCMK